MSENADAEEGIKDVEENGKERPAEDSHAKNFESWTPKTELGRKVKSREIPSIDEILDSGIRIMEAEIVDFLMPGLVTELLMIGQAKGKFGGGQRRAFRQTQKKTAEGNKPSFGTMVVVGNRNGYVGLGRGKSKETLLSREKATRNAKLNIIKIKRGCGSWQCGCRTPHTIPFRLRGTAGSVRMELLPAPKGAGLRIAEECRKILALAGVKDVWSRTYGQTRTTVNLIAACFDALRKISSVRIKSEYSESLGLCEGSVAEAEAGGSGEK